MMEFYETAQGKLGLREIPSIMADLLRQIPYCVDWEGEAVEARLFPEPSLAIEEETLREDWKAHVEPELHELFQSSRQVVEADLRAMQGEDDEIFSLEFPVKHAEAWLNALNQARLALAAEHGLADQELARPGPHEILTARDLAMVQINFYAALQQWLVEVMDI